MNKRLHDAFAKASYQKSDLSGVIWYAISHKKMVQEKRDQAMTLSLGVLSFVGLFPVIANTVADFRESGVYEYLSLAFSSGGTFALYWKEIVLSIVDAIPVASLLLSATIIFAFFYFVRRAALQYTTTLQTI